MNRLVGFALAMSAASTSYAACLPDAAEIGDNGPGSLYICEMLEARYPQLEIEILDRRIVSSDTVAVYLEMGGQAEVLEYNLVGAQWQLAETSIAGSY